MPKRRYFIPRQDGKFFSFQRILVTKVETNKVAWGIPDSAIEVLANHRAIYEPLYHKAKAPGTRTVVTVMAHRMERRAYEKDIRKFVNAHIRNNDKMTDADRSSVGVPPPDKEPSPKPKINETPFVGLDPLGGGSIKVTCRRTTDEDRPSMHNYADVIECRYTFLPVHIKPVEGKKFYFPTPEECQYVQNSTRSRFIIKCASEGVGMMFFGYFRWVNQSNPANSGSWTEGLRVVIA